MSIFHPSRIFLVIALVYGLLFLVLLPPFQAPDEAFHFLRAYQVSQGTWGERGDDGQRGAWVPDSVLNFLSAFDHVPLHPEVKVSAEEILRFREIPLAPRQIRFIPYVTALPHPPLPYLPQALGVGIGRALDLSPFYLFYLGRVFNLLLWIALIFAALRLTPVFRWLLTLLALTPMSLHQAASLSPDAVTNGAAFFFFAGLMRLVLGDTESISPSRLWPSLLSSLVLTFSKLAYAGESLFLFLISPRSFCSRKAWAWVPVLVLANLALGFEILKWGGLRPEAGGQSRMGLLLHDPLGFAAILGNTFRHYGLSYLEQFLGTLGHLDTRLPTLLLLYQGILLLCFACVEREPGRGLSPSSKVFLLFVLLAEILAIWTGLYLTWMEEGGSLIRGGQGRYLIPLAPFFFLLFYRPTKEGGAGLPRWFQTVAVYSVLMILSVSLFFLWRRFYGMA